MRCVCLHFLLGQGALPTGERAGPIRTDAGRVEPVRAPARKGPSRPPRARLCREIQAIVGVARQTRTHARARARPGGPGEVTVVVRLDLRQPSPVNEIIDDKSYLLFALAAGGKAKA